jgi:hypothetical protein
MTVKTSACLPSSTSHYRLQQQRPKARSHNVIGTVVRCPRPFLFLHIAVIAGTCRHGCRYPKISSHDHGRDRSTRLLRHRRITATMGSASFVEILSGLHLSSGLLLCSYFVSLFRFLIFCLNCFFVLIQSHGHHQYAEGGIA